MLDVVVLIMSDGIIELVIIIIDTGSFISRILADRVGVELFNIRIFVAR